MVNENIDESIPATDSTEKKSLLEKYDIEINKLDFDYVEKCKDVKELEKIVKILRSGEEGHYKELQQLAEDRLQALAPKSRVLRKEEPVIRKESMMPEEREIFDTEMKEWEKNISSKDEELMDWNKNYTQDSSSGDYMLPPVRRAPQSKVDKNKQQSVSKKPKKPAPSDYTTWDKYDAESEILKMEAEEERENQDKETQSRKQKAAVEAEYKRKEHSRLNDIIKMSQSMPDAEKSSLALSEKDRGNEYYKTCNYDDAISYYSASVTIHPSAVAYNNRAACYLKQGKYDLALSDCNKCLELDPENAKGLYRRGLCLQHKNQFDEALQDMQSVLRKEPHNLLVQHVAKELRQQCRSVPKSVRMLVEEQDDKMVEISEAEAKGLKDGYEINEWGLARNMCNCCRVPPFLRTLNDSGIAENLIYKPENDDDKKMKKKKFIEKELAKANKPDNVNNNEPIIETICNGNTDNGIETNRIVYGSNVDNETDELIPKKIKIIETVKSSNNPNVTNVREKQPKKCNVKDMRGQSHVHGQQQTSEMTEQFENIKLGEPSSTNTATTTKPTAQNKSSKSRKSKHKQQSSSNNNNNNNNDNDNQEANERNNQSQQIRQTVRNYEFNGLSERQPINVASKYTTQKVASAKNINNNYKNNNKKDVLPNNINNSPSSDGNTNFYESINPYQFLSLWSAVKESSSTSLQEYANILRRISPSSIHKLLGNKLDGTMLTAMLKTLANEFDVTNNEAELVKQYLVSLSNAERFRINVQFLNEDMKQMICGLIDKVGGDDKNSLKESYLVM